MDILKALRAEESKFRKQMDEARKQVETVRHAIKLLGGRSSANRTRSASPTTRRRMSAAGRARIAAAQRKRWAKVRAGKKS
jgi:uncharacterized NAD(P)/FAD-binding protein YdhS